MYTVLVGLIGLLAASPAEAARSADGTRLSVHARTTVRAVAPPPSSSPAQCEDFAERQVRLASNLLDESDFTGALRVLNVAAKNCDIPLVRSEIADVLDAWYAHIQNRGATSQLDAFVNALQSQPYLPSEAESELRARLESDTAELIARSYRDDGARETYRLCRKYATYSDQTFGLRYRCGSAARNVRAYGMAINAYEWLLDNWSNDQSYASWDDVATALVDMYLSTSRFAPAFDLSKRLTIRSATPENLLTSLASVRALLLEPIAQNGRILFDGVTPDPALQHVKSEMQRIDFPEYVQSLFLLTGDGTADAVFYGSDAAALPPEDQTDRVSESGALIRSADPAGRAWLIVPVDAGSFVVQFTRSPDSEENVILENLLNAPRDDDAWDRLYAYQFDETSVASGSAVATLLGGAYLAGMPLGSFDGIFDAVPALAYFCIQDEEGAVVDAAGFSRASISYADGVWTQSSKTPALYHHEVTRNGASIREIVWPTYDSDNWLGVVRVGLTRP